MAASAVSARSRQATEADPDMTEPGAAPDNSQIAGSRFGDTARRVASAVLLAPIALISAWAGGWVFAGMLAIAAIAMALEVCHLVYRSTHPLDALGLIFAVLLAIVFAASGLPSAALALTAAIMAFALAGRLWREKPVGQVLIAYPYLVLPFVALIWLRNDPSYGLEAVFWLLVMVWAIDSFAYFAGRTIGGPKLMPSISPKKTWAGLIGGMLGAVAAGVAAALMIGVGSPILLGIVSAGLAVVEQLGDFYESAMKRRAGLKDSGHLIPGHGGMLDRVDGLIAVTVGAALLGIIHNAAQPAAGVLIWP